MENRKKARASSRKPVDEKRKDETLLDTEEELDQIAEWVTTIEGLLLNVADALQQQALTDELEEIRIELERVGDETALEESSEDCIHELYERTEDLWDEAKICPKKAH